MERGYIEAGDSQLVCPPQSCKWLAFVQETGGPPPARDLPWGSSGILCDRNLRPGGEEALPLRWPLPWAQPLFGSATGCDSIPLVGRPGSLWVWLGHSWPQALRRQPASEAHYRKGGVSWPWCQWDLSNSGLPSWGPWRPLEPSE